MNGKMMMYIDQYGMRVSASTVKELRAKVGGGRVSKMYRDTRDDATGEVGAVHVGYVVGMHWFSAYVPAAIPA